MPPSLTDNSACPLVRNCSAASFWRIQTSTERNVMYTKHRHDIYHSRKAWVKTLVRPLPSIWWCPSQPGPARRGCRRSWGHVTGLSTSWGGRVEVLKFEDKLVVEEGGGNNCCSLRQVWRFKLMPRVSICIHFPFPRGQLERTNKNMFSPVSPFLF